MRLLHVVMENSVVGRSVKSHYFQGTRALVSIILVNVFNEQISKYETIFHACCVITNLSGYSKHFDVVTM